MTTPLSLAHSTGMYKRRNGRKCSQISEAEKTCNYLLQISFGEFFRKPTQLDEEAVY